MDVINSGVNITTGVNPDWITVGDAARLSGYEKEYVRSLARGGRLTHQKFGHTTMISRRSVLEHLEKVGKTPVED